MRYGDNLLRHELKYFINLHEYTHLKRRLDAVLEKDRHAAVNDGYHVRSLYFDDIYNSALYEKKSGIFERKKYRIRIYNLADTVIRLEKKSKYDKYISKKTADLTKDWFYAILQGDCQFLLNAGCSLFREFYIEIRNNLLKPAVIVDYEREAYTLGAGNVRITFDKDLRAGINSFDIFDDTIATKAIFDKPVMILEIKYGAFLPTYVHNLLQICSHNISAASKYALCMEAVNSLK